VSRWYKRCGADFIHGTMMLTLEEKGAYSLCLDLIYDRGGPIPDDARWLAGVCGVSLRKWSSIRERLLSLGKIASDGQHISNSRAELELVSSELHARKLAESGSKGGRKRAENAGQANKNNDLAQAPLKHIREDKSREEETPNGVLPAWSCPPNVDPNHWRDLKRNRKTKRLTNTETAYTDLLADLDRLSDEEWPPGKLVQHAAAKGWAAIHDPRKPLNGQPNGNQPKSSLRGNRPDPALDLYRAAVAEEQRENGEADSRTRVALPSYGPS
jgi:uncharacterized protein YdaU (DUF1376 family)